MLNYLHLKGVGPSPEFGPINFAPRLNIITGDNGLGKSFLLDITWWALTRTWPRGNAAIPQVDARKPAISYSYTKSTPGNFEDTSTFKKSTQEWPLRQGRPAIPGVVIYAGVDGSFSAWDPARNYWNSSDADGGAPRPSAFNFSPEEVWNGLTSPSGTKHCNGLIRDWVMWQKSQDPAFSDLKKVLHALSPSNPGKNRQATPEYLEPGRPLRLGLDVTEYPSVRMPYGQDVALTHASAGIRRIAALAYLLVWTWNEHLLACKQTGRRQAKEIIFLIDEIECHLHPQWQRQIVPALMRVMQSLTEKKVPVQLLVATHSPLVLTSIESAFDPNNDAIFSIELEKKGAHITEELWAKQGDVVNWLVSDMFGLKQARSIEAETVIEAAEAWMRGEKASLPDSLNTEEKINKELVKTLASHDHFWPRWITFQNKK